jgi:NAD(P)-dependent dehydrogenase (short-subunit alcohol dehydrogenase family)
VKVVIIGGTSGVGLATAQKFGQNGGNVIIAGRDPQKLNAALQLLGASYSGYTVDATSEDQLKDLYIKIGRFDHLILSLSGAKGAGLFTGLQFDDLRAGFEAKFWAQVKAAQKALPYLTPSGSITFVTAVSAQMANPGTSGLAAINGAIESMIPVLAVELAPLRVNGVSPGVVDTPWWNWLPPEQRQASFEQYSHASLVGRVGQPEDIAQAIHALATNGFITGQILAVDGGLRLKPKS